MATNNPQTGNANQTSKNPILVRYEPVIGLEVHCQLNTVSKLFCGCSTAFGALPNHHTCPVCLGLPGALPVLNQAAVDAAIKVGLAVGATIQTRSVFERKQYFYPDLPKGYQISQFEKPYCTGGGLRLGDGSFVELTRIHMEEDAGKSVHEGAASYVDLNRAGTPLLEIVTEPVLHSPTAAVDYLKRLRSLVRHLEVSDGNLEEGSFRCDANVSIRPRGETKLGTRCEIKNLNSFRNIEKAIGYEIARQADLIDHGDAIVQETRLFDAAKGRTQTMRTKEESDDYRYFPDPDLRPVVLDADRISRIEKQLPELPDAMSARLEQEFGLGAEEAGFIAGDRDLAAYFEAVVKGLIDGVSPKIASNWIITEVIRFVNDADTTIGECSIGPDRLAAHLNLIGDGTISGKIAKKVFFAMEESTDGPRDIVEAKGWVQITDPAAIEALVSEVLADSESQVQEYLGGKQKVYGFFVGEIMKRSGGKMNPEVVNQSLQKLLAKRRDDGN